MRTADRGEDGSERESLTVEDATRRIDELRHVYDEGYISRTTFETMVRLLYARVTQPADPADERRLHAP